MIIQDLIKIAKVGTKIPKPKAKSDYRVKEWKKDSSGNYLMDYTFPQSTNSNKLYRKSISEIEFIKSYNKLVTTEEFTTAWYKENFSSIYKNAPCNFTTIGGLFELLGIAVYEKSGVYKLKT